jgi:hypothetical protein
VDATAKGSFEVKMSPQPWSDAPAEHGLGRFLLDKQYSGDLDAVSQGQMLSFGGGGAGSSGVYVAIEKVSGSLAGRKGAFVLYHTGIMNKGLPTLTILVSPDSGTGELTGLTGTLNIAIANGKHTYSFNYTLPQTQ